MWRRGRPTKRGSAPPAALPSTPAGAGSGSSRRSCSRTSSVRPSWSTGAIPRTSAGPSSRSSTSRGQTFEEHGGRVEKFIGDAAMAVFGVPQVHGDDPDRAVAAALALIERVGERDEWLELRIGIETGEVLAESGRADLAVTGEATSAAARLQQAAAPDEILVGERAAAGCRRAVLAGRPGDLGQGIRGTVGRACRHRDRKRPARSRPRPSSVGARSWSACASATCARSESGAPPWRWSSARPGWERPGSLESCSMRSRGSPLLPEVLVGRNPPYGDGIAFWAFGEILRAAGRVGSDADSNEIHDALEMRLTAVEPERRGEVAATLVAVATGEGERRQHHPAGAAARVAAAADEPGLRAPSGDRGRRRPLGGRRVPRAARGLGRHAERLPDPVPVHGSAFAPGEPARLRRGRHPGRARAASAGGVR